MTKFTVFTKEHVGEKVTYISKFGNFHGEIVSFNKTEHHQVKIKATNNNFYSFTTGGFHDLSDAYRCLYFGHNIKVKITGEEVPKPKLICPSCGVEHIIRNWKNKEVGYYFDIPMSDCPLYFAAFPSKDDANQTMKNLIKAMDKS